MFTENMGGCWLDGGNGFINNSLDVIDIAQTYGFEFPPDYSEEEKNAVISRTAWDEWEEEDGDSELLMFAVESAENFLAELAPRGYWVGWRDGDFGMWEEEDEV